VLRSTTIALVAAVALASCQFLPQGDNASNIDAWNRSNENLVAVVGPDESLRCFDLRAGAHGRVEGGLGGPEYLPRVRIFSRNRDFVTPTISMPNTLLIVDASLMVTGVAIGYKSAGNGSLLYDLPNVPQLDGQPVPKQLPADTATCHDWFGT
jgi:hypothetical protein